MKPVNLVDLNLIGVRNLKYLILFMVSYKLRYIVGRITEPIIKVPKCSQLRTRNQAIGRIVFTCVAFSFSTAFRIFYVNFF